jgi:hypothetical protein
MRNVNEEFVWESFVILGSSVVILETVSFYFIGRWNILRTVLPSLFSYFAAIAKCAAIVKQQAEK